MKIYLAILNAGYDGAETLSVHRTKVGAEQACLLEARQRHNNPFGQILWKDAQFAPENLEAWDGYWSTESEDLGSFEERRTRAMRFNGSEWWDIEERSLEP